MSKQVDERVLSMQFDNRQFEANVATSMSTLDKLKAKLNLSGASKGLESVQTAAKNVNMSPLASGIETVHNKFSALEIMGVTALVNITNQAVNAGKRIVSALTIDPVKTGFSEYETQINATQTILANVGHKGKTLDDVNAALDELNKYADQTIYNFTEMTRNIGLFTNAGVGLDEAVSAIKGFSNAAAMAGTDATRTAGAMYQLSQAMSSGSVKLMDWRSLEQANITGERFQETIKITARAHGIAIDSMIAKEGSLRETLKSGWLTADLMSEALNHYTLSTETMTEAEIKANEERLKSLGYTDEQIKSLFELGTEATNAATKVKTFSQLWGVLQESAQSGWSQTWKLIIGDFEEAKNLLTPLANFFTEMIDKVSTARNRILEIALDFAKPWTSMVEKLGNIKKAVQPISAAIGTLESFQDVVTKVWRGDFNNQGDNPDRRDLLRESGWDPRVVQTLVNLGYGYKLTMDDVTAAHEKYGLTLADTGEEADKVADAYENLTDQKLKDLGLTDEEIRLYRALEKEAKRTGMSIAELADEMSNSSGRDKLINSFKNIGSIFVDIGTAIKNAFTDIFDLPSLEELGIRVYGILTAFENFTKKISFTDDEIDKLTRTFKGLFAILDIVLTIVGGPIKIVFKILSQILEAFDLNILDVTAVIGDAIVKFRDWLDSVLDFTDIFRKMAPYLKAAASAAVNLFNSLKNTKVGSALVTMFNNASNSIRNWINGLKEAENIGQYIIDGLMNGLGPGARKVVELIASIGKQLLSKIKEVLGIHSPSKEFESVGGNVIDGLYNGISSGISKVVELVKSIGSKLIETLSNLNFGEIFVGALGIGALLLGNKLLNVVNGFVSPLGGLADVFNSVEKAVDAKKWELRTQAILNIAKAILILSIAVIALSYAKPENLRQAMTVILELSIIIGIFTVAVSKFGAGGQTASAALLLIAMAGSILLLITAAERLSEINADDLNNALMFILKIEGLAILLVGVSKFAGDAAAKAGAMLVLMAYAIKILADVAIELSSLEPSALDAGAEFIAGCLGIFTLLLGVSTLAGDAALKAGVMLILMAVTIKMMIGIIEDVAGIPQETLDKGGKTLAQFGVMLAALIAVSYLAGTNALKAGIMLLAVSVAIMLLVKVINMIAEITDDEIKRGLKVIEKFGEMIVKLLAVSLIAGNNAGKAGAMILAVGAAMLLLVGAMAILTLLDEDKVESATETIMKILTMLGVLIAASSLAGKSSDSVEALAKIMIALGILAVALVVLSFLDPAKVAVAAGALAVLMGMLSLLIYSTTKLQGVTKQAQTTLLILVGVIALLAGVLVIMSKLNVQNALANAGAISVLLLAISASLYLLNKVNGIAYTSYLALGALILVAGLIGILLGLLSKFGISASIETASAISVLLLAMSGSLVLLSKIGGTATSALKGIGLVTVLILALVGVVALLGALNNEFPGIEGLISNGLPLLGQLGEALGTFLGKLVGGFLTGISSMIAEFPLLRGIVDLLIEVLEKLADCLASTLASLGQMSLTEIGKGLLALAGSLLILAVALKLMKGSISGAAALVVAAAGVYAIAEAMSVLGSLSLGKICVALLALVGTLVVMAAAAVMLAPLLPAMASLAGVIVLLGIAAAGVGIGLSLVAQGMMQLITMGTVGATAFMAVLTVVITGVLALIPVILAALGAALIQIAGIIVEAAPSIGAAVLAVLTTVLQVLITLIPLVCETIATLISCLLQTIVELTPDIVQAGFDILLAILEGIADNIDDVVDAGADIIVNFLEGVGDNIDDIIQAGFDLIIDFINGLASGIENNAAALDTAVTNLISAICTAITNKLSQIREKGAEILTKVKEGIEEKLEELKTAVGGVIEKAVEKVEEFKENFKSAAKNIIDGLLEGIQDKIGEIIEEAKDLGSKLWSSFCEALGIESPSKVFAEGGRYIDEGIIVGLNKYSGKVVKATQRVGTAAFDGMKSSIGKITDVINSDIDAQPTIRPVLDLSDVASGAGAINGMFNMTPSVGVLSNVRSIGAMMNGRQNGGNGDIISAIDDLKSTIGGMSGNTYQINGITYDDGSNINSAVETLVRAARIERRV